jgi:hypothetical protein
VDQPEAPAVVDVQKARAFLSFYSGLLDVFSAASRSMGAKPPEPADPLMKMLAGMHGLLLEHPVAAKACFQALMAEGRAFAETEQGRELKQRLERSEKIAACSALWRTLSLGMLEDTDPSSLPSTYLDQLLGASAMDLP